VGKEEKRKSTSRAPGSPFWDLSRVETKGGGGQGWVNIFMVCKCCRGGEVNCPLEIGPLTIGMF